MQTANEDRKFKIDDAAYGVENGEDVKFPDEESSTTEGAE